MFKFNNDWDQKIDQTKYKDLFEKTIQLYQQETIYPIKEDLFNALKTTSYADTKVVILGQDPYHNENQAHGYAFSVLEGNPFPPSLRNIFKELENEYQTPIHRSSNLEDWAKQGVLLLNTILTVKAHQPLSLQNLGWQEFTLDILKQINKKPEPVVYLLWGAKAIEYKKYLNNPNHLVLTSPHPSPLSARRGFFGNDHFKKTNEFLIKQNKQPIQWF